MVNVSHLAPANWKEWTRAGVLQAFIIAFYAEMYGFPLTLYFLSRFFDLNLAWREGGNLWEQLFGTPMAHIIAMVLGYLIVFGEGIVHWPTIVSAIGFPIIVAAYTFLARKEERQMLSKFGEQYREYQRRVPMFFPRIEKEGKI